MPKFNLDDNHRLRSDDRQWLLEVKTKPKGDKPASWRVFGYYTTLTTAINACYGLLLRKSDADSIVEFMADSKRIFNGLVRALSPIAEIKEK